VESAPSTPVASKPHAVRKTAAEKEAELAEKKAAKEAEKAAAKAAKDAEKAAAKAAKDAEKAAAKAAKDAEKEAAKAAKTKIPAAAVKAAPKAAVVKAAVKPVAKPAAKVAAWSCPADGAVHPWPYKGKKFLRNSDNQVWEEDADGGCGDWQGVYIEAEDRIDDSVEEPSFDEE
jgi:multidrug efflux pump subunit AcrA (membrane-fusion protein)